MTTGYNFKGVDLGKFLDLSRTTPSNHFKEDSTSLTSICTDAVGTLTDFQKINVDIGYKINGTDIKGVSKAKSITFSPGNYAINSDTYGDVNFRALLVGGGGGGGGGGANYDSREDGKGGNGGGSGGAILSLYMNMGDGITLTVGSGGAGGAAGRTGTAANSNTGENGAAGGETKMANNIWSIAANGGGGGGGGGLAASATVGAAGTSTEIVGLATRQLYTSPGNAGLAQYDLGGGSGGAAGDASLNTSYSNTFPESKSVGGSGGAKNSSAQAPSGNFGGGGGGGGGSNQNENPGNGGNGGDGYAILWFYPMDQT